MIACWGYLRGLETLESHVMGHLVRLCGKKKLFTVKSKGINLHLGAGVQQTKLLLLWCFDLMLPSVGQSDSVKYHRSLRRRRMF